MLPSQIIRKDAAFIGRLAVINRMVDPKQLEEALLVQARLKRLGLRRRLKDVLIDKGWVEAGEMAELEEIQARSQALPADAGEGVYLAPRDVEKFARIAMDHDLIPFIDLQEARETCAKMREMGLRPRMGAVLREKGYLHDGVVRAILERELKRKILRPATIGLALVVLGAIGGIVAIGARVASHEDGEDQARSPRPRAPGTHAAVVTGASPGSAPLPSVSAPGQGEQGGAPASGPPFGVTGHTGRPEGAVASSPVEPPPIWPAEPSEGPPPDDASYAEPPVIDTVEPSPEELMRARPK